MIRQIITLPKHGGWKIYAYYATTGYAVDEIMERMWEIGVDARRAKEAYDNLSSGKLNSGLCYSNYRQRKSVFVVALTTSPAEFFNSLVHEVAVHLCMHIATCLRIDVKSEEYAYLVGDLCGEIYPAVKHLLCDCECHRHNSPKYIPQSVTNSNDLDDERYE